MRKKEEKRSTKETSVIVKINLDGSGKAKIDLPIEFFSHMLSTLARFSMIDLTIESRGDLKHHIIEDTAICLGQAIRKSLGDASGIKRFGYSIIPMDGSLARVSIDLSNRPYYKIDLKEKRELIEDMPVEDVYHFFNSLVNSLKCALHLQVVYGENDHHKIEAAFKALAISLRQAISPDPRRGGVPSTKGVL